MVVAGGRGARAGLGRNKVFFAWKGRSVLSRCLDALERSGTLDGAVLVLGAEDFEQYDALCAREGASPLVKRVVAGGDCQTALGAQRPCGAAGGGRNRGGSRRGAALRVPGGGARNRSVRPEMGQRRDLHAGDGHHQARRPGRRGGRPSTARSCARCRPRRPSTARTK